MEWRPPSRYAKKRKTGPIEERVPIPVLRFVPAPCPQRPRTHNRANPEIAKCNHPPMNANEPTEKKPTPWGPDHITHSAHTFDPHVFYSLGVTNNRQPSPISQPTGTATLGSGQIGLAYLRRQQRTGAAKIVFHPSTIFKELRQYSG